MVEYKLTYYDARGYTEPSRWILCYGGATWKEERIPFGTPVPDELKSKLRFKQVPLLEFGNNRIVQSRAIARFLARKFNLAGKNEIESAHCDEIVDACVDLNDLFWPFALEADPVKKAEGIAKSTDTAKDRFFSEFSRTLKTNGKFLVGDGITWADFFLAHFLYDLEKLYSIDILGNYPELKQHYELVTSLPGIKEWLEKRADTKF